MSIVLITGSCGLVGSESVKFFCKKGFDVLGIDNNYRKFFFGNDGDTHWVKKDLINKQEKAINRDLIFCVTPDEEIGSKFGMAWLVENHPELLEIEYALNEGGYGFRDIEINKAPIFGIGIAEKKLCWIKVTAIGSPGHGSQPNPSNATVQLNIALEKIINFFFSTHSVR